MDSTKDDDYPSTPLTFGMEVSFFTAIKRTAFPYLPLGTLVTLVARRFREATINNLGRLNLEGKVKIEGEGDFYLPGFHLDYTCWNFLVDRITEPVKEDWFKTHHTESIETISPIYPLVDQDWEAELNFVYSSHSQQYNTIPARELRLYCEQNFTTRFHVHIGNLAEPEQGFEFQSLRNLAMILLVYESELDKMVQSTPGFETFFDGKSKNRSPVDNPYFQDPNVKGSRRNILALHLLNTCSDTNMLIEILNPPLPPVDNLPPYFKYNFTPLLDSMDHFARNKNRTHPSARYTKQKHPTVEFCHHPGTLDPETMIQWVKVLAAIVEFSKRVSLPALLHFLGLERFLVNPAGDPQWAPLSPSIQLNPNPKQDEKAPIDLPRYLRVGSMERLWLAMEATDTPFSYKTAEFWIKRVARYEEIRARRQLEEPTKIPQPPVTQTPSEAQDNA